MTPIRPAHQELLDHRHHGSGESRPPDIAQLRRLAQLMDSAVEIPGLGTRVGLDGLLGLFPGFGDLASSLVTLYILQAAANSGVSRWTMARMAGNSLVDLTLGSVPVVGDVFDIYWKSNQRNVELLHRHLQSQGEGNRSARHNGRLFLAGVIGALVLALIGSITVSWYIIAWLAAAFHSSVSS